MRIFVVSLLLLLVTPALAEEAAPSMEQLLRFNGSIDPLIQQRDSGLNALALCQGDLKTLHGKLSAAENASKDKDKDKDPVK